MKILLILFFLFSILFINGCTQKYWDKVYKAQTPLVVGMTKSQVAAIKGYPRKYNKSVYSWGITDQWIYGYNGIQGIFTVNFFAYFKNGKLSSWHKVN